MILSHCHPKHSFVATLSLLHHGIIDRFAVFIDVPRLAILQTYLVNIRYEALEQSQFKLWGMWSVPPCIEQQAGVEKKSLLTSRLDSLLFILNEWGVRRLSYANNFSYPRSNTFLSQLSRRPVYNTSLTFCRLEVPVTGACGTISKSWKILY